MDLFCVQQYFCYFFDFRPRKEKLQYFFISLSFFRHFIGCILAHSQAVPDSPRSNPHFPIIPLQRKTAGCKIIGIAEFLSAHIFLPHPYIYNVSGGIQRRYLRIHIIHRHRLYLFRILDIKRAVHNLKIRIIPIPKDFGSIPGTSIA